MLSQRRIAQKSPRAEPPTPKEFPVIYHNKKLRQRMSPFYLGALNHYKTIIFSFVWMSFLGTMYYVFSEDDTPHRRSKWERLVAETKQKFYDEIGWEPPDEYGYLDEELAAETTKTVCILVTTEPVEGGTHVQNSTLQSVLIPSIEKTVNDYEIRKWKVRLYVGLGLDDTKLDKPEWLDLRPLFLPKMPKDGKTHHEATTDFNDLASKAVDEGCDYLVHLNNDSELISRSWITYAWKRFQSSKPFPNVGVVGTACTGMKYGLKHYMVHKTHMEIFHGRFYPDSLPDSRWYQNQWMTQVYMEKYTSWQWPFLSNAEPNWLVKDYNDASPAMKNHNGEQQRGDFTDALRAGGHKVQSYLEDKYMTSGGELHG